MDQSDFNRLIHDINSAISSLGNALEIIETKLESEPELIKQMVPLCRDKSESLAKDWEGLKALIKK